MQDLTEEEKEQQYNNWTAATVQLTKAKNAPTQILLSLYM